MWTLKFPDSVTNFYHLTDNYGLKWSVWSHDKLVITTDKPLFLYAVNGHVSV